MLMMIIEIYVGIILIIKKGKGVIFLRKFCLREVFFEGVVVVVVVVKVWIVIRVVFLIMSGIGSGIVIMIIIIGIVISVRESF